MNETTNEWMIKRLNVRTNIRINEGINEWIYKWTTDRWIVERNLWRICKQIFLCIFFSLLKVLYISQQRSSAISRSIFLHVRFPRLRDHRDGNITHLQRWKVHYEGQSGGTRGRQWWKMAHGGDEIPRKSKYCEVAYMTILVFRSLF